MSATEAPAADTAAAAAATAAATMLAVACAGGGLHILSGSQSAAASAAETAARVGYDLNGTTRLKEMDEMPTLEGTGSQSRFYRASGTGTIVCRRLTSDADSPCHAFFEVDDDDNYLTLDDKRLRSIASEHSSTNGQIPPAVLKAYGRLTLIDGKDLLNTGATNKTGTHTHTRTRKRTITIAIAIPRAYTRAHKYAYD